RYEGKTLYRNQTVHFYQQCSGEARMNRLLYPKKAVFVCGVSTMIVDCFTFFNELELLEIRLKELGEVVDKFVLVESTLTFQGKPKPLFFRDNASRFAPFQSKIDHVIVDMPETDDPWVREGFQRNSFKRIIAT